VHYNNNDFNVNIRAEQREFVQQHKHLMKGWPAPPGHFDTSDALTACSVK
jgi:hypothetical protein